MRWLSSVALLFYFSVLCTPQAFAVHDVRLSPLADSQLYALTSSLQQQLITVETASDDPPAALLVATAPAIWPARHYAPAVVTDRLPFAVQHSPIQPRAPPARLYVKA